MAEEHPLALCLATKRSPETTVEVAAGVRASERQLTLHAERARRETMSGRFAELGALIPNLSPRASRAHIVEEAIAYVRVLRDTTAELEAYRAAAAAQTRAAARVGDRSAEVIASVETSCFAVRLRAARPGALTRVLEVFHQHDVAVLAATVARNEGEAEVTVTTAAVAPAVVEMIKAEIINIA